MQRILLDQYISLLSITIHNSLSQIKGDTTVISSHVLIAWNEAKVLKVYGNTITLENNSFLRSTLLFDGCTGVGPVEKHCHWGFWVFFFGILHNSFQSLKLDIKVGTATK